MLALTFQGELSIKLETVPKPELLWDTDVVVRVTSCSICGSDLHPFHGRELGIAKGTIVGHEYVGVVEQVGTKVSCLQIGDRVMSPFTTCCGACFYCSRGSTCRCQHPQAQLFGWIDEGSVQQAAPTCTPAGLHGSQAQYVRVPLADSTLVKVPEGVADSDALLLGDILSTAFFCADNGGIAQGDLVAVVGCGPVGLLAAMAAQHMGAGKVLAVDGVPERRAMAERLGAHACQPSEALQAVHAASEGRGADVVLELVGAQAALGLAFQLLRPAGTLSSVGVHTSPAFPFTPVEAYNKNITFRSGRCPARAYMDKLLPLVREGRYDFSCVFTHRMPLSQGAQAYQLFDSKADGCIKVLLDPWADC